MAITIDKRVFAQLGLPGLRDEPGSGSVSRDRMSLSWAAAGEQDAVPVVVQVAEPAVS